MQKTICKKQNANNNMQNLRIIICDQNVKKCYDKALVTLQKIGHPPFISV